MATRRQRKSGSWEFVIQRKGVLPRAISLTFATEKEGKEYCARLEHLLDQGIVPPELSNDKPVLATVNDVIRAYINHVSVAASDKPVLATLMEKVGKIEVRQLSYDWAEGWVKSMKQVDQLAPSTIKHYVGSLARALDYLVRLQDSTLVSNPLRLLPKRYATYTDTDAAVVRATSAAPTPADEWRERRLEIGEETAIRRILDGEKPEGRQRPLKLEYQGALELMFNLAIETAMRMREIYTLTLDQVNLDQRTIFLDKTKNGSKRQVPLSSVAVASIKTYLEQVEEGGRGMADWQPDGQLLPWWRGSAYSDLQRTTVKLSAQFGRIFSAAGCADLRFHDLRHEATSRLYERTTLSDLKIAKITGHKDPRMLARYANLRASDLADQLW